MSTSAPSRWSLRKVLTYPIAFLFSFLMSNHTKRLFYFASLYGTLVPLEQLKSDMVVKLNKAMKLARADDALMVPAACSRVIWGQDEVLELLETQEDSHALSSDEEVKLRAYMLVKMTSDWLRFGTFEEMRAETERFIRCVPRLMAA